MNATSDATESGSAAKRDRLRFELIFASICLAFGLFLMPALIYAVGAQILGPYEENSGFGRFYADFFVDLAEPSGRAWAIAIGPAITIYLLRALFPAVREPSLSQEEEQDSPPPPVQTAQRNEPSRREPRVSLD